MALATNDFYRDICYVTFFFNLLGYSIKVRVSYYVVAFKLLLIGEFKVHRVPPPTPTPPPPPSHFAKDTSHVLIFKGTL